MGTILSANDVQRYRREGYLCPISALSPDEARHYRESLEAAEAAAGGRLPGPFRHRPHLIYTWAQDLIRQPRILDAVQDVIGPDILAWESVLCIKEPEAPDVIGWHQDITHRCLDRAGDVVTAWLALGPSTAQSGCLRVVPGTHASGVGAHRDTSDAKDVPSPGRESAAEVNEAEAVDLVLRPGQIALHHVRIVLGSHPNRADDRHVGFAVRYLPPHVRPVAGKDSATLVRGEDRCGHLEHEPAPKADLDPGAIAYHEQARERRMATLMQGTEKPARTGHAAPAT